MDLMCPANMFGAHIGKTNVLNLARGDGIGHCTDGLLDRNVGVRVMEIPKIDRIDTQPL